MTVNFSTGEILSKSPARVELIDKVMVQRFAALIEQDGPSFSHQLPTADPLEMEYISDTDTVAVATLRSGEYIVTHCLMLEGGRRKDDDRAIKMVAKSFWGGARRQVASIAIRSIRDRPALIAIPMPQPNPFMTGVGGAWSVAIMAAFLATRPKL